MKNYNILKKCCEKIFLIGSGNFWFEEDTIGDDKSLLYRACSILLFFMFVFVTILEIMAIFTGDFPMNKLQDAITLGIFHIIVLIKIILVILNKNYIRSLNMKMIRVCEQYEKPSLMTKKYRIIKINIIAYFINVVSSCFFFIFEAVKKVFDGSTFLVVVTYYPSYEDKSYLATACRVYFTGLLLVLVLSMMLTVDTLTVIYLIMYKYKFITLRIYFEDLRTEFDRLNASGKKTEAEQILAEGLIEGIVMHNEVLSLSKDIDKAFGTAIAFQLLQSSATAVSLLLQITLSENLTLVASLKVLLFVTALFFLLGLFLCNAGEITYQASLLPDAIFSCGWHACSPRVGNHNIRKLVLLAINQAQKPIVMMAFKMVELTYPTFLAVIKSTYSVFTLIYAQNK